VVSAPAAVAAVAPAALVEIETREGAPQLTLCKAAGAMHGGSASGPEPGLGLAPGKPAQISELPVPKPLPSNVPKKRQDRKRSRQERDNELAGYATCFCTELELPKLVVSKLRSRARAPTMRTRRPSGAGRQHVHGTACRCARAQGRRVLRARRRTLSLACPSREWPHTGPSSCCGPWIICFTDAWPWPGRKLFVGGLSWETTEGAYAPPLPHAPAPFARERRNTFLRCALLAAWPRRAAEVRAKSDLALARCPPTPWASATQRGSERTLKSLGSWQTSSS